jgi:hypothetical protein
MKRRNNTYVKTYKVPFVNFLKLRSKTRTTVNTTCYVSAIIGKQIVSPEYCIIGYDDIANEIIIVPKATPSDYKITHQVHGQTQFSISLKSFLNVIGMSNLTGKYEAYVDDEGNIHAMLNNKLDME